jgi:hypothetical protein
MGGHEIEVRHTGGRTDRVFCTLRPAVYPAWRARVNSGTLALAHVSVADAHAYAQIGAASRIALRVDGPGRAR